MNPPPPGAEEDSDDDDADDYDCDDGETSNTRYRLRRGDNDVDGKEYNLLHAYTKLLQRWNMNNQWKFDERSGTLQRGPRRVVNAPIASLTTDAV